MFCRRTVPLQNLLPVVFTRQNFHVQHTVCTLKLCFVADFVAKNLQLRESTVFCNILLHQRNKKDGFSTTVLKFLVY